MKPRSASIALAIDSSASSAHGASTASLPGGEVKMKCALSCFSYFSVMRAVSLTSRSHEFGLSRTPAPSSSFIASA
ncbi:MAG: hypothetical protein IPJ65_01025 [Archangiaceae bacterium]|nr:hypothetical protein [Archangiaceae bacterium]